jgi:hypothetical protein
MFNKKVYPDEIANFLINNTEAATETDRDALTDIIYALLADAENDRNPEACRTLYRAMEELTATKYEITAVYYANDWKKDPEPKRAYYKGDTLREAYTEYCLAGENHDLAKYTPREIASVDSYTTI